MRYYEMWQISQDTKKSREKENLYQYFDKNLRTHRNYKPEDMIPRPYLHFRYSQGFYYK
jgi:hypothetical protein